MSEVVARARARRWWLVHLAQLPSLAAVVASQTSVVLWPAALLASVVCCAGTDSGWRWRNRVLIAEAVVWLSLALIFGAA